MSVVFSSDFSSIIRNKYVYLDCDILSAFYHDEIFLKEGLGLLSGSFLVIDSFTEFEFLRDVYLPGQFEKKRAFLSYDIFSPATNHQELFSKIEMNAILLSRIYMHQNLHTKSSLTDLFLAARLMYQKDPLLITGNKKHFPSCIFDTLGIVNVEQTTDVTVRAFCVVQFNEKKFSDCYENLQRILPI